MSNEDEGPTEIELELVIHPEGMGVIRNVIFGGGGGMPMILIQLREHETEEGTLVLGIETGAPFKQTGEGVSDLADILETIVTGLRSTGFMSRWEEVVKEQDS